MSTVVFVLIGASSNRTNVQRHYMKRIAPLQHEGRISLAPIFLFSPTIVANGKLRSAAKTTNHHADHIEKFASELPQNAPNNAVATQAAAP